MKINSSSISRSNTLDLAKIQRLPSPLPKYYITEVIKGDKVLPKHTAYYKVGVNGHSKFYIVQNKDCRTDNAFTVHYDKKEKARGSLFPPASDPSKPVAIVDGSSAGLYGYFEIYDTGRSYFAKYKLTPFIHVPEHTQITSEFLLTIDNAFKKLPVSMLQVLYDGGVEVILGRNVEDTYYHYYPQWKVEDSGRTIDPTKPWIEKTENGLVDNRLNKNSQGGFVGNKIFISQTYIKYGTKDQLIDRTNEGIDLESTAVHEAGHVFDFSYEPKLSDVEEFQKAHAQDVEQIPQEGQDEVLYFIALRKEAFTEVLAALLGGLSSERTYTILSHFPKSSEYIREHVLPLIRINMSIEDVRENIYPAYLVSKASSRLERFSNYAGYLLKRASHLVFGKYQY